MSQSLDLHLRDASRRFGWIEGLDLVLEEIATLTALIARDVRAGAIEPGMLGEAHYRNVQDEDVKKLDEVANALICDRLRQNPHVAAMASEEEAEIVPGGGVDGGGQFFVMFDPLDGSSNIDVNATIGTIFSIYHRSRLSEDRNDLLFSGQEQVAAGYAAYGSSTMFVYTARNGVHGFTLDPKSGAYVQTHPDMRCPPSGSIYSINEGNRAAWTPAQRDLVAWYQEQDKETGRPYSGRYIGSLVADFHRTLIKGGVFIYPSDAKNAQGKLRYLYEAAPLALVCEEAGGAATNGEHRILELRPGQLHQRTPLFIGSQAMVAHATGFLASSRG